MKISIRGSVLSISAAAVLQAGCVGNNDSTADRPKELSVLSGDYLGQKPPGATPELFAPGVVSTGLYERDVAMTPDGNEFHFGLMSGGDITIVTTKRVQNVWSRPEIAPFCGNPDVFDLEPHITPDGRRFLFLSTRPREGEEPKRGWANQDIWAMDRTADGWGPPYNLGDPVNTDAPEFFPSVTRGGTIYFTRDVSENGRSRSLILRARPVQVPDSGGPGYAAPEILPPAVNPGDHQFNAFIDPGERYLIVCMAGREQNIGACDYYVCFRGEDDTWSGPVNMGDLVNTPGNNVGSPYVSPDGRHFFFASNRRSATGLSTQPRSYEGIQRMTVEPQNGNADIYWMDASFIESLKPAQSDR